MPAEELQVTDKQAEVLAAVRDAPITGIEEIFLIGAIGTSKTFVMAYAHANCAYQFQGCIIPVGRKDLSEAQIGTFLVYLEVLEKMGLEEGHDYTLRQAPNDLRIRFANSSIIQFVGMNKSRDREFNKLKVTATMAGVDEVDDVDEGGYDTLYSRTGRRNENGAPRVMLSACNPNDAWTKHKIYLPWLKRIGRRPDNMDDDEWNNIQPLSPKKMVIEFNMEDSFLYNTGYYDRFLERPRNWRERYLFNNWNYFDDENSLFKARAMDKLTIQRLKAGEKFIGVDPNAGGSDRASICLWEGDTIVDAEVYTTEQLQKLATEDEKEPDYNYGAIIGRLTLAMAERERVPARNIALDVVGIGQGTLTYLLAHKYNVEQFRSGNAPYQTPEEIRRNIKPAYQMLRDQVFAKWSMDVENGRVFFYGGMPFLSTLKKELQLHEADTTSKVMRVTSKDKLKPLLGGSPDIADSAMMGYWVRMIRTTRSTSTTEKASVGQSFDEMYNGSNGF